MASLLSGIGTLYLLVALVVISHALQIGIVIMVGAVLAGAVLPTRPTGTNALDGVPDLAQAHAVRPGSDLPPAERLAVQFAEEPSERVPAPRPAVPTEAGRALERAGR